MFKVLKEKGGQLRILYLVKLSLKSEEEIHTFLEKQNTDNSLLVHLPWCKCY